MGRWAQRTRGGGGTTPSPLPTVSMTEAQNQGGLLIDFAWSDSINVLAFGVGDFITHPGNKTSAAYNQTGSTTAEITFSGNVSTDTSVTYRGNAHGILTPQTLDLIF